ncbi:hypothetical protein HK099_007170, partial [Clydaea vesicula]
MFGILVIWRTIDLCFRTYDHYALTIFGTIVRWVDPIYLGSLSVLEIWSSIFLVRAFLINISEDDYDGSIYKVSLKLLRSGVPRVVFINLIPMIRLVVNQTVSSSFEYSADASTIIYYLQVSMNLLYLIDHSLTKLDVQIVYQNTPNVVETTAKLTVI